MSESVAPKRRQCPSKSCGSFRLEQTGQGVFCTECGLALDQTSFDLSVQFTDSSDGSRQMQGSFLSSMSSAPYRFPGSGSTAFSRESREVTIANGKKRIQQLAAALKLNQYVDSAHRLFLTAVQRNFVHGRKTSNVVAACLYVICRQRSAPHLLIDFSDVLQTNVFTLGNCFLKFRNLLNLELPAIDPSHYIERFASKLEFGAKTHEVARTAHKLAGRMKRDWIQTGRRPAGLCGAALIMSARMHGFNRTQKEVVHVMKVCEDTLRKRLSEFEQTAAGELAVEDLHLIESQVESCPPSFTRNREKEQRLLDQLQDKDNLVLAGANPETVYAIENGFCYKNADGVIVNPDGSLPVTKRAQAAAKRNYEQAELYKELEKELMESLADFEEQKQLEDKLGPSEEGIARIAAEAASTLSPSSVGAKVSLSGPTPFPVPEALTAEEIKLRKQRFPAKVDIEDDDEIDKPLDDGLLAANDLKALVGSSKSGSNDAISSSDPLSAPKSPVPPKSPGASSHSSTERLAVAPVGPTALVQVNKSPNSRRRKAIELSNEEAAKLLEKKHIKQVLYDGDEGFFEEDNQTCLLNTTVEDDNALFDAETEELVLNDEESRLKKVMWQVQNKDFLEKERQDRLEGKVKRKRKFRTKEVEKVGEELHKSVVESTASMRKLSKKINYQAWDMIFKAE